MSRQPKLARVASLWTIQSIIGACQMDFSWNFQNTAIMFHPQDILILLFLAWMLNKGFSIKHFGLIIPWLFISFYVLYCYHWQSVEKLGKSLSANQRYASSTNVVAFYLHSFGLLLQALIIVEISRLALKLWAENDERK
ncbi:unnamed protein product [Ceutorhynchus assimilis]|uniref:Uncharacterized protein n=1 Tax=Ceutorhynchus assimilis TaxID=467358 RepID=A0A9N9QGJ2_9CUCU|nr:unnamed protein product [Ceutorhynchus assimilis]